MSSQPNSRKRKRIFATTLITMVALGLVLLLTCTGVINVFERKLADMRFRWRGIQPTHKDLVLVGIDDTTCDMLGQWPWSTRQFYALYLDALSNDPPAAIGFDILFKPRDETARTLELGTYDTAFAQVTSLFDVPPCVGYNVYYPGEGDATTAAPDTVTLALLKPFELGSITNIGDDFPFINGIALPYQELANAAFLGFLNAPRRDPDGVLREVPLVAVYKDVTETLHAYPSISLCLLLQYYNVNPEVVNVAFGEAITFLLADDTQVRIPVDDHGFLRINYAGTIKNFHTIPFVEILRMNEKQDFDALAQFSNKIMLTGLVATGTTDLGPIPLSAAEPLVSAHLNALNTVLLKQYVIDASPFTCIVILICMAVIAALIAAGIRPRRGLALTCGFVVAYIVIALMLFNIYAIIVPLFGPVLVVMLVWTGIIFYRYLTEEKQKLWIRRVLKQYLSDSVMQELLQNPEKLQLGGERRDLTVLFADIAGFTSFCENRTSEEVVRRLNEFMDSMTEAIFLHNGTLDKYVGDEIVAFFGAPGYEHANDHAKHAVDAAVEMLNRLEALKQKWREQGEPELNCGIGINSGEMIVGNMGSSAVFDYTVIGDEVNLGARVEGLTRKYDVPLIITESTCTRVQNLFDIKPLGEEHVKGRNQPVKIFTL